MTGSRLRKAAAIAAAVGVVVAVAFGVRALRDGGSDRDGDLAISPGGLRYEYSNSVAPLLLLRPNGERQLTTLGSWTGPAEDGTRATGFLDGGWVPGSELESIGRSGSLDFWFAMPGWTWQAELVGLTDDPDQPPCWRRAVVTTTGDRTFTVDATGPRGTYRLNLYGSGPQGNQGTEVRWTTTVRGEHAPRRCAG